MILEYDASSPLMHSSSEARPRHLIEPDHSRIRAALDAHLAQSLPSIFLGICLLYAFFAGMDWIYLPAHARAPVSTWDATMAILLAATTLYLHRHSLAPVWAHPIAFTVACLALANTLTLHYLTLEPLNSVYLVAIEVGVGIFFLSTLWLGIFFLAFFTAWMTFLATVPTNPGWTQATLAIVSGAVLSVLAHTMRVRSLARLERLRIQDTERRLELDQALTDLRQSEERFRTLSEGSQEGVVIHEDGRILEANLAFARLFGHEREELGGRLLRDFIKAESHPLASGRLNRADNPAWEALCMAKDGRPFPAELSATSIPYRGRTVQVTTVRDVTERKRIEEAERRDLLQRSEIDRLKEVSQFKTHMLNTMGHELNTPLTPVLLHLQVLKSGAFGPLNPDQQEAIELVDRNMDRLRALVQDSLDVARLQSGKLQLSKSRVDLAALVREVAASYRTTAETRSVGLDASAQEPLWVEADPRRLSQVIYNLLSNALKFTGKGGSVSVKTRREGDRAVLTMRDTGIGLTPEQMSRLFEPFSQVHDAQQGRPSGTGLGLYISRGIIEAHGGRLWCESSGAGQGSTFSFALELAPASSAEPGVGGSQQPIRSPTAPRTGRGLVL